MWVLAIIVIIASIVIPIWLSVRQKKRENSLAETLDASVINKRQSVETIFSPSFGGEASASDTTFYFVTFDISGIGRREFGVSGKESGCLVVGDKGKITMYIGKKYLKYIGIIPLHTQTSVIN